jgi:hypothetical protein
MATYMLSPTDKIARIVRMLESAKLIGELCLSNSVNDYHPRSRSLCYLTLMSIVPTMT